jgi:hypothetical protein
MIDSFLAQQMASILAPYMPFLIASASVSIAKDAAIKALGGKFVDATWNMATDIWAKIKPNVEKDSHTNKAFRDIAAKSQDARSETVLSWQLENLDLPIETLKALQNLIQKADGGAQFNVASSRGIATQGVSIGNTFNTGDQK